MKHICSHLTYISTNWFINSSSFLSVISEEEGPSSEDILNLVVAPAVRGVRSALNNVGSHEHIALSEHMPNPDEPICYMKRQHEESLMKILKGRYVIMNDTSIITEKYQ